MNIDRNKLAELLTNNGLQGWLWHLPDETYETVSDAWVLENWREWVNARPNQLCVYTSAGGKAIKARPLWIADASDCDNLALGTLTHAQVGNALTAQRTRLPRGGLAFGMLFYTAAPAREENFRVEGGHAINWFVDHEGNVRFFEPGMGELVDLNAKERSSAWFGLAA